MFRIDHFLVMTFVSMVAAPMLSAQPSAALRPATVTLVAGPIPSKGGRTEVIRQARGHPQNLIIIDKTANADDLAAALATINALRLQDGDSLTSDFHARTERVRLGPKWANSEYRKWLVVQLARLNKAERAVVGEFGRVQSVRITLPAPRIQ